MDPKAISVTRSLVRPIVTVLLALILSVCLLIYAITGMESAFEAAKWVAITGIPIFKDWFESRRRERENGNG